MQVQGQHGAVDLSGHEAALKAAESQLSSWKGIVIQLEKVCAITLPLPCTSCILPCMLRLPGGQLACHWRQLQDAHLAG